MEVAINISGHKELTAKLNQLQEKVPWVTAYAWRKAVNTWLIPAMRQKLRENKSIYQRTLYESFKVLEVRSRKSVRVRITAASYAGELELGTGPRHVDFNRITDWLMVKHHIKDINMARYLALAVVEKIAKVGSVAHPFIKPAIELTAETMIDYVFERVRQKVRERQ